MKGRNAVGLGTAIAFVALVLAGCQGQSPGTTTEISSLSDHSTEAGAGTDAPIEPSTETITAPLAKSSLELREITAQDLGVLSGGHFCVDESSLKRTCVQTGDHKYPSPDNLFLDVAIKVKNLGDVVVTLEEGYLTARYEGRDLRYDPIERETSAVTDIQALGSAIAHQYFEVPIEVLNNADLSLSFSHGEAIDFAFETPASKDAKKQLAIAEAAVKEDGDRLARAEEQKVYDKCWALKDDDADLVRSEDYGWYVEHCSSMYNVDDYDTYLKIRRSRGQSTG